MQRQQELKYFNLLKQISENVGLIENANFQNEIEAVMLSEDEKKDFYRAVIEQIEIAELTKKKRESLYVMIVKLHLQSVLSIKEQNRTHAVYLEAIKQTPEALEIIPESMRSYEIFYTCVTHPNINDNCPISILKIPLEMRDAKMCTAFIKLSTFFIKELVDYKTTSKLTENEYAALCAMALEKDPLTAIQYIPQKLLQNADQLKNALKKNWRVLKYLSNPGLIDQQIYNEAIIQSKEAVRDNWEEVRYIPESILDDNGYQDAVQKILEAIEKNTLYLFNNFPAKYLTKTICLKMIDGGYGDFIEHIKNPMNRSSTLSADEFKEICLQHVIKFKTLTSIPVEYLNEEIYLEMVKGNWENLENVPKTLKNYLEICQLALAQSGLAIRFISHEIFDYESFCLKAIKKNPLALQYINKNIKSYNELCLEAVELDWKALQFVPDNRSEER